MLLEQLITWYFRFILDLKNFDDLDLMLKILDDKRKRIPESGSVRIISGWWWNLKYVASSKDSRWVQGSLI